MTLLLSDHFVIFYVARVGYNDVNSESIVSVYLQR